MRSGSGSEANEATCNVLGDATGDISPTLNTTIPDLFSEFSALLSLDRYTPNRKRRYYPYTKPASHVYTPPDPKLWTEPFSILSLPRELRDTIYAYALYSPSGLLFTTRPNQRIRFGRTEPDPTVNISLFLVSRQIYAEAFAAFWRCNSIRIGPKSGFRNHLRLFPEPARISVQNVIMRYDGPWAWGQICSDAKALQQDWFPALKQFKAVWTMTYEKWSAELGVGLMDGRTRWEDKVAAFEGWLRRQYVVGGHCPPRYLSVVFVSYWNWDDVSGVTSMFGEAWKRFRREIKEIKRSSEEELAEELKESRRKWLEEEWGEDGKGTKGRRKGKGARKQGAGSQ